MADDVDWNGSGVPDGWHPDGLLAGLPAMNAAAGGGTLGAVMTPEQIADVDWGDGGVVVTPDASAQIPSTVGQGASWGGPIGSEVLKGQGNPAGTAPDPSTYARLGEMAGQLQADPYDPDGNTGNAGFMYTAGQLLQFHRGDALDAQAHGGSRADGNYDFGVYNAAMGLPLPDTLDLANTYGKYFSTYPPDTKMDQTYKSIPIDNVQNITKGYNDYQNEKFGGTP